MSSGVTGLLPISARSTQISFCPVGDFNVSLEGHLPQESLQNLSALAFQEINPLLV
jgi:hypothetical protein